MDRTKGVTAYAIAIMFFGIYNLLGAGNYANFAMMFKGLNNAVIWGVYLFTVFYGICGVYCGSRMLRLEDWARKMMVALTSFSVIMSFIFNKTVFANFKQFIASGTAGVPPDETGAIYRSAVILAAFVTVFEISVVFYFTRPSVKRQFGQ